MKGNMFNKKEYDKNYRDTHKGQGKKCTCPDCGKKIWFGSIRCKSCARKEQYRLHPETNHFYGKSAELHPKWKGGWKYFCKDCGKKIDFNAIRCQKHAKLFMYKNHPEMHPMKGTHHSKITLNKMRKAGILLWSNEEYRNRTIKSQRKGMKVYPNKPEIIIKKLLSVISKDYKYVGDGSFIINGFNPDFINKKSNKIIELYGTYWHKRPEVIKRDIRRIKSYKKYGYKTLIIWEHELINIGKVTKKLVKFI
jgi:G:T-mismatch repair DNA endonuclease (very short patch repair protein)